MAVKPPDIRRSRKWLCLAETSRRPEFRTPGEDQPVMPWRGNEPETKDRQDSDYSWRSTARRKRAPQKTSAVIAVVVVVVVVVVGQDLTLGVLCGVFPLLL